MIFAVTATVVLLVAQLGSYLVHTRLPLHDTYVVNSVLHLTHVRNSGGVFGLFPGNSVVFAVIGSRYRNFKRPFSASGRVRMYLRVVKDAIRWSRMRDVSCPSAVRGARLRGRFGVARECRPKEAVGSGS
jgi:hypothetical protein